MAIAHKPWVTSSIPGRLRIGEHALATFGDRVGALARLLMVGDPLADAAEAALATTPWPVRGAMLKFLLTDTAGRQVPGTPRALVELCEAAMQVPAWVDRERCDRGGGVFRRNGLRSAIALGLKGLLAGYTVPASSRTFVLSGVAVDDVAVRFASTLKLFQLTSLPGALEPGAAGFREAVRVRLAHAHARRMLAAMPQWDASHLGVPLNQADTAGSVMLFSTITLDGLRQLGTPVTFDDAEDVMHLWRYIAHLLGVVDELSWTSQADAMRFMALVLATQEPANEDSRVLTRALVECPRVQRHDAELAPHVERAVEVSYLLARHLLGPYFADPLELPPGRDDLETDDVARLLAALERTYAATSRGGFGHEMLAWPRVLTEALAREPDAFERWRALAAARPHRYPSRVVRLDEARARHGSRADRLAELLRSSDDIADDAWRALDVLPTRVRGAVIARGIAEGARAVPDAPAAFRTLLAHAEYVPPWVELERCTRGGSAFLRQGPLGAILLGFGSLVGSYCSPGGNKPLVLTRGLIDQAFARMQGSAKFVHKVSQPGALAIGAAGYRALLHVRLMHARVRQDLLASEQWRTDEWGLPINQADMAVTPLLFSLVVIDHVRKLGGSFTPDEAEDYIHLWRYAGYLSGVRDELLCATVDQARELFELVELMQGPPDEDSRRLMRAMLDAPLVGRSLPVRPVYEALVRLFVGDERADALGVRRNALAFAWPAVRTGVRVAQGVLRALPHGDAALLGLGNAYWRRLVR